MTRLACAVVLGALLSVPAAAQPPKATEVRVEVGTADGRLVFTPADLSFERGRYYRLVLHNASPQDHYFTSDALATHVFTRKVEVADSAGRAIAEIHGAVNDIELKPGATVEWYFYPMTNGERMPLYCHKDDHREQDMVGTVTIAGPPPFTQ